MMLLPILSYFLMIFVLALKYPEVEISDFEIEKQSRRNKCLARRLLAKKRLVPVFNRVRGFWALGLAVIFALGVADLFKFWDAILIVSPLTIIGFIVSRINSVRNLAQKIFSKITPKMYDIFEKLPTKIKEKIMKMGEKTTPKFASKAEALDFLFKYGEVFDKRELGWFEMVSRWGKKTAGDLAVGRDDLDILHENDLLTPLVIDELFKSGRDVFVVMDGYDERVLGVVKMAEIAEVGADSKRVREVMREEFLEASKGENALTVFEQITKGSDNFAIIFSGEDKFLGILESRDFYGKEK